ncbi:MAG: tetratricopeptide repeat protein [bacterium]|nr:tetratricopeptide repeat protein [bacterium]
MKFDLTNWMKLNTIVVVLFIFILPKMVVAASARQLVNEGNRLLSTNNPEKMNEAVEKYLEAREKRKNRYEIPFNIGTAYSDLKRNEEAINWLLEATKSKDPKIKADAFYQLGNIFLKQKQYEDAIKNYTQSLRYDPGDSATRKNLELAFWLNKLPPPDSTQHTQKENDQQQDQNQQNQEKQQPKDDQMLQKAQQKEAEVQKRLLKKRNEGDAAFPTSGKDW